MTDHQLLLDRLLSDSRSTDWSTRADAAAGLARLDDAAAVGRLTELLTDDDLAVIEVAAAALVRVKPDGVDAVLRAYAEAEDNRAYPLRDVFSELALSGADVADLLRGRLDGSDDPLVRQGVTEINEDLHFF